MFLKTLSCVCLALILAGVCQGKEWRGIIPLHSTRADVERLLGPPSPIGKSVYETKDAVVIIDYSEHGCEHGKTSVWNVPLGTVTAITVNPRSTSKLSELKLDLSKFKVIRDEEVRTIIYYINEEEGIHIETRDYIDYVISTIYFPTAEDRTKFRCS
jgi:hypothetical protein